jgi:hypothetical protein
MKELRNDCSYRCGDGRDRRERDRNLKTPTRCGFTMICMLCTYGVDDEGLGVDQRSDWIYERSRLGLKGGDFSGLTDQRV